MPAQLTFQRDYFCLDDQLGFDRYVETLGEMIASKSFQTPFCIGIHGEWGSGKTSFMRQLEKRLQNGGADPAIIPVWFNPWRYAKEEHLIIPFLRTIAAGLEDYDGRLEEKSPFKGKVKAGIDNLKLAARAIAYGATFKFSALALSGKDMIEREKKLRGGRVGELTEGLSDIYYRIIDYLQKAVKDQGYRLVIFIDDLDRCLPEKAVELLEAIKLILDLEGYLFVVGVNRRVVEAGIREHYKFPQAEAGGEGSDRQGNLAEEYLEKIIQMPLELPPIEPTRKRKLILSLLKDSSLKEHAKLIEHGIAGRPRDIVRFVNFVAFFARLAERLKIDLQREPQGEEKPKNWRELVEQYFSPEFYLKWAILAFAFRREHRQIIDRTGYFLELQGSARPLKEGEAQELSQSLRPEIHLDERLRKVLEYGKAFFAEPWLIRKYVHLAASVGQVIAEGEVVLPSIRVAGRAKEMLAPIGAMVKVLRGPFLYGEEKETRNLAASFEIDVYPVTNGQFLQYLQAVHAASTDPIDQEGNRIIDREQSRILLATAENGSKEWIVAEGYAQHPVTGVTWHGVLDFCHWRTEVEHSRANIFRLPTEEEWEKAARGDNGNEYPWGNDFDPDRCNTKESAKKGTTEVTAYPLGKSPYGCYDMAGNVWEWTSSHYAKDSDSAVLRGGSWRFDRSDARCASRFRLEPDAWNIVIGFRCARSIQPE